MSRVLNTCVLTVATASVVLPLAAQQPAGQPAAAWWRHVQVLADDSLAGRDAGSPGHESAVRYIAAQFAAAGLQPAGTDGWFQPVRFVRSTMDDAGVALALSHGGESMPLRAGRDVRLTATAATRDVDAPLVFAGYGLSFPEAGLDELADLDVRGKIVVYVNGVPDGLSTPMRAHFSRTRWEGLARAGAVGMLAVGGTGGWEDGASRSGSTVAIDDPALDDATGQAIRGVLNPALMPRLLEGTSITWDDVVTRARGGAALPVAALRATLRATLPTVREPFTSPNVVGILPGTDPALRDEIVVYTAHSDHVGVFRGPALTGDSIFNGAMDIASGAATLLETARLVAERGGNRRTLAFVAVTAEEKGLLGSRYFAARPSFTSGTIVANLNTDMFLPINPLGGVFAYGYEESELADDLDAVAAARGFAVYPDPEPEQNRFVRSDQYSFIRQGIPALAFKVGYVPGTPEETVYQAWVRERYHKLSDDTSQPVNFETAAAFNAMYADLAIRVANRDTRPRWRTGSFFAPRTN
jgi:hypothetical protein